MEQFLIGIAASLAAAFLFVWISKWRKLQWFKRLSGSAIFRHGVEYVYPSQKEATRDITSDILHSKEIRIFTMRGYSFILPEREFSFITDQSEKMIRFLIANPGSRKLPNPEIFKRGKEYKNANPESYRNDICSELGKLRIIMLRNKHVKCRLHSEPATFRVVILDDRLYLSFFSPYQSGSQLPIHRIKKGSLIYQGFLRHFEAIWDRLIDIKEFKEEV